MPTACPSWKGSIPTRVADNRSNQVLAQALLLLGGRALEELIHGDDSFSVESALALEQVSTLLLKNSVLLNLNKNLENPAETTEYHPDYYKASDPVKRNIEANVDKLIGQLYDFDKEMIQRRLKEVRKLRKLLLKKEVLSHQQICKMLKLEVE